MIKIAFTGRRPKDLLPKSKAYNKAGWNNFFIQLKDVIKEVIDIYPDEDFEFISGGAQGFDQMAFWAVHNVKKELPEKNITNTVYIPFENQDGHWLETGLFGKNEYRQIREQYADKVVMCNENVLTDYGPIVKALMQRNSDMINNADIIIALYPDNSWTNPETHSGTADAMRKAAKLNKGIVQLKNSIDVDDNLYIRETESINTGFFLTDESERYDKELYKTIINN